MAFKIEDMKKIMIPVDGSDYSIRAAHLGISLAKVLHAEILVIYVIDTVILEAISRVDEEVMVEKELKDNAERYVNYVSKLAQQEGLSVKSIIVKGQPHDQIVYLARSEGINMIIMGTHGQRGASRVLIGSVAESEKLAKFVLTSFSAAEKPLLNGVSKEAARCAAAWVAEGAERAMTKFNRKQ